MAVDLLSTLLGNTHKSVEKTEWCKDGHQFFVVTLQPSLRKVVFPIPGVHVLVTASDQYTLTLNNVSSLTTGTYTCEAMSDQPAFISTALALNLTVIELPTWGPTLMDMVSVYQEGETLHARCTVVRSRPHAHFSFSINNYTIPEKHEWIINNTQVENKDDLTWNSSATLSIKLSPTNMDILLKQRLHEENHPSGHHPLPRYYRLPSSLTSASHSSVTYSHNNSSTLSSLFRSWSKQTDSSSKGDVVDDRESYQFLSRHSVSSWSAAGTQRVNLTCIARVSTLTFHTSTWSLLAFPNPKRRPIVVSKLFGISGCQTSLSPGVLLLLVFAYLFII
ncbi:hypothetical protein Pcinc_010104 [Petrolisthes cinctipes]|uniref:Ig-like domain-containing protein n=1 Tax=Petrolisthes cinctipes TaxID=88211 RepID=A0AAE1G3G1_PETCI|nr:hypothetical protein Pcinc_010104 [Petrolisthes cinctipes]